MSDGLASGLPPDDGPLLDPGMLKSIEAGVLSAHFLYLAQQVVRGAETLPRQATGLSASVTIELPGVQAYTLHGAMYSTDVVAFKPDSPSNEQLEVLGGEGYREFLRALEDCSANPDRVPNLSLMEIWIRSAHDSRGVEVGVKIYLPRPPECA